MRIGIEAQRLFRKKKHGMEVVALELIRHLQALDHENQYFIFVKDDEDRCIQETDNFRIIVVPGLSYPDWEQVHLPNVVKKYHLDVLHCTCNTAPLRVSVPLVLTLHDIIYLESVSFSGTAYQNFGNLYRRWAVPRVVKKCRKIITVSCYEQQSIRRKLPVESDNIQVVYNAINSSFKVIDEAQCAPYRQQYQFPERFILYFANPSPKKNAANTFLAYQHYVAMSEQPLPLVVADTSQPYIYQLLSKLNLTHLAARVQVIDFIPFATLPYVYNLASLFLYPSKRESFGMPILEAMACGTPVITSTTSAMPEVAGPAALQADPLNPSAIGQHIYNLLSDQVLQDELIKRGQTRASDFTWQRTARQVLDIYRTVFESNLL
jgi:glycosyltransferase involved in cell wall biosynthesis